MRVVVDDACAILAHACASDVQIVGVGARGKVVATGAAQQAHPGAIGAQRRQQHVAIGHLGFGFGDVDGELLNLLGRLGHFELLGVAADLVAGIRGDHGLQGVGATMCQRDGLNAVFGCGLSGGDRLIEVALKTVFNPRHASSTRRPAERNCSFNQLIERNIGRAGLTGRRGGRVSGVFVFTAQYQRQ